MIFHILQLHSVWCYSKSIEANRHLRVMGIFRWTAATKNPSCSEWSRPFGCRSLTDDKSLPNLHTLVDDVPNLPLPLPPSTELSSPSWSPVSHKCPSYALKFWQKHLCHSLLSYTTLNLICRCRWNWKLLWLALGLRNVIEKQWVLGRTLPLK